MVICNCLFWDVLKIAIHKSPIINSGPPDHCRTLSHKELPLELVEKLAALVPPPRFNLVRYSGIFAPAACWRSQIVSFVQEESGSVHHGGCGGKRRRENPDGKDFQKPSHCHPRNYSWSELMKRVFEIDVLVCDLCGGRMRILCAINAPDAIAKILDCLGLPSRPPPISPAV